VELIRVLHVTLYRLGAPDEPTRDAIISAVDKVYPAQDKDLNSLLTELMVYLQAPSAAAKGTALLAAAPTQEEQIDQARHLRFLKAGWTLETRRSFLDWFNKARGFHGGANFADFMKEMRTDALANVSEADQKALADVINAPPPAAVSPASAIPRPFVKEWKMDEAAGLLASGLKGRDFDRGRALFSAANCYGCHRFGNEGGSVGPDLTGLSGRFSSRDILESVLEPSKVISDQYAAVQVVTTEGKVVVGRIVNLSGDTYHINTNMLDPNAMEDINRANIEEMGPAKSSMMPNGLLNTLKDDELLDLMAFLLSRGDRKNAMFAK
jgi:putative heme-binding domain-containing protein